MLSGLMLVIFCGGTCMTEKRSPHAVVIIYGPHFASKARLLIQADLAPSRPLFCYCMVLAFAVMLVL